MTANLLDLLNAIQAPGGAGEQGTVLEQVRLWLAAVGGLLTPLIAVLAVIIARRQYVVQRQKLMLDLFEKRYAIYQAALTFIGSAIRTATSSQGDQWVFDRGTFGSAFLFGQDVTDYLKELRSKAIDLEYGNQEYERLRTSAEPAGGTGTRPGLAEVIRRKSELLTWFSAQLANVDRVFAPYLDFTRIREARARQRRKAGIR